MHAGPQAGPYGFWSLERPQGRRRGRTVNNWASQGIAGLHSKDDNQILLPDSFTALFIPPGHLRPSESRQHIASSLIHQGLAYELSLAIDPTPYGHHLRFLSHVPTARRPEQQVRFQTTLSGTQLQALRDVIDRAISPSGEVGSDRNVQEVQDVQDVPHRFVEAVD